MTKNMRSLLAPLILAPFAILVGCSEPGPAEQAGQTIDEAVEDVKDALDPAGPAEKAGREIDEAAEKLTDD